MASCDIQIVNSSVLNRIESFMADASYREAIENSANYNTRLCVERRLRMPFLDSQTGVAQNHSNLFMTARERIPGLQYGQVYTYPSKRWRKKRRQYLMQPQVGLRRCEVPSDSSDLHTISTVENPAAAMSEDSKDSAGVKDESAKSSQDAWYYDDFELHSMEGFDDQDPDSDYDYEETYSKRRKKGRGGKTPGRGGATPTDSPHPKKGGKGTGQGRGRKKGINYAEIGDSEKPFSCDRPPAKRGRPSAASQQQQAQAQIASSEEPIQNPVQSSGQSSQNQASTPHPAKDKPPDSMPECSVVLQQVLIMEQNEKPRATPSPYCDFCLGDAVSNKKSGQPEELVSCSDCGRSGHPSCLLFTNNMIVSVRKYRWQCIECKCCSICGTSDNDDQLLFCDDCDRGYHMYCLVPPLHTPPEGSWSCRSCIRDFH
ncbi:zinc finger protein ubi-d4 A isoform X7 [Cimex lectularius]|uniref:PHD-type domain-containing protein n=1 Tax=Cimex lectularius TaxID=79782 RepID=A0A8I6S9D2_CIMLE|nr:zinc finger protein ubi-d4 A isoform X7 [Cimex lectularius]